MDRGNLRLFFISYCRSFINTRQAITVNTFFLLSQKATSAWNLAEFHNQDMNVIYLKRWQGDRIQRPKVNNYWSIPDIHLSQGCVTYLWSPWLTNVVQQLEDKKGIKRKWVVTKLEIQNINCSSKDVIWQVALSGQLKCQLFYKTFPKSCYSHAMNVFKQ